MVPLTVFASLRLATRRLDGDQPCSGGASTRQGGHGHLAVTGVDVATLAAHGYAVISAQTNPANSRATAATTTFRDSFRAAS